MIFRRATLPSMDLQRMIADVCDIIDAQGGDWDAVEAAVTERWSGDELAMALDTYAATLLWVYREQGGPAMIRQMRDWRRRLVATPPPRGWSRWRATG